MCRAISTSHKGHSLAKPNMGAKSLHEGGNYSYIFKSLYKNGKTPVSMTSFANSFMVIVFSVLCCLVAATEAAGKNKEISSRETIISGVCEGVTGSNYQNYVAYNRGQRYAAKSKQRAGGTHFRKFDVLAFSR
jgi:hypothetical protein